MSRSGGLLIVLGLSGRDSITGEFRAELADDGEDVGRRGDIVEQRVPVPASDS